jgi:catechol 2,3-dioxygenase-like lactoylglutathione lyase family enzyme
MTATVRYIVDDVDASIEFYRGHLGFSVQMHPAPTFAILVRDDLRLLLSAPSTRGGGGQVLPDGTRPLPGGWNRFSLEVPDLEAAMAPLRAAGVRFRSDVVVGVGGNQVVLDDPSGNPVELFQPTRSETSSADRGQQVSGPSPGRDATT